METIGIHSWHIVLVPNIAKMVVHAQIHAVKTVTKNYCGAVRHLVRVPIFNKIINSYKPYLIETLSLIKGG